MKLIRIIIIYSLFFLQVSQSSVFCVTDTFELQFALSTADNNSQSDIIKISEGHYLASVTIPGFKYLGTENKDLEISGGWVEFLGIPCGGQLNIDPYVTILDGDGIYRVLEINTGMDSNITISNVLITNGFNNGIENGLALEGGGIAIIDNDNNQGDIRFEHTVFIGNSAVVGGALSLSGNKITMKNNLFTDNHSESGSAIRLMSNNAIGIYFTNNTIVSNTSDGNSTTASAGLNLLTTGTSQAVIANNIFWDNEIHQLKFIGNNVYLYNNDIVGTFNGTNYIESGNISSIPLFEAGLLNFTPSVNSEVVGHGIKTGPVFPVPIPFNLNWVIGDFDNAGNNREQGNHVDIGAYESPYESWIELPIFKEGFE